MRTPLLFLLDLDFTGCFSSPQHGPVAAPLSWTPEIRPHTEYHPHLLPPLPLQPWVPGPVLLAPDFLCLIPLFTSTPASPTWTLAPASLPSSPSPTGPARVFLHPELACLSLLLGARQRPWTESQPLPFSARAASLISFSFLHLHSGLSESHLQFLLHKASGFDRDPWYFESA